MLDVEPLILDELDRLAHDTVAEPDWQDVLVRTEPRASAGRRRLLLLATAAVVALAVAAVAFAAGFGGFRTWLTGEPGKPASPAAQSAFARSTRAWRGFPHSTSLRRLVSADVAGAHYELDGFRGAGGLCLRLVVTGSTSSSNLSCAPLADLKSSTAPALVLAVDHAIGSSGRKVTQGPLTLGEAQSAVTFGVVADGVDGIRIAHQKPSPTRTFVAGDAFLAVSPRLSPFDVTTGIVATAGAARATVPFVHEGTPFSPPAPVSQPSARGPAKVQRHVTGGAIRWFARREPRGEPAPHAAGVTFARLIAPDPAVPERMVVSIGSAGHRYFNGRLENNRQVCAELVGGRYVGGACWPAGRLFTTDPFTFGVSIQRGGQVSAIDGLASDDVARLRLFTATGGVRPIPLHDNGYLVVATLADFPIRLVAYDRGGLIVGSKVIPGYYAPQTTPIPRPAPGARWTRVLRTASGSVYSVHSTTGGLCLAFKLDGGVGMGCDNWSTVAPNGLRVNVGSDRKHSWVEGIAGSHIAKLRLTLRDGRTIVSPVDRYVLIRLAQSALRVPSAAVKTIEGLDENGRVVARQG